jgi:DNA (cytosine-5)-methyltransferase 1
MRRINVGSLCSGYGGLDIAVEALIPGAEPVWFAENAPGPSAILAHRYPGVPNHGDLTVMDWYDAEPIDILTGGWPCQPWSAAGKRKGAHDERAIWPEIARAVRELRPGLVLLENVARIAGVGELARAVGSLSEIGYDARWRCLRASDVGAPHRRERCFIVATDTAHVGHEWSGHARGRWTGPADRGNTAVADADGPRTGWHTGEPPTQETGPGTGDEPADDRGERPATGWGPYRGAIERWEHLLGRCAPAPTEAAPRTRSGHRLSPRFVEWMMGLPDGWVTGVPDLSRNDQLKALGNGVVPQQAIAAYADLLGLDAASVFAPEGTVAGKLLPTPRTLDASGVRGRTSNRTNAANYRAGTSLTDVTVHLLPTPSVALETGGQTSRSGARKDELLLGGIAEAAVSGRLLPTPRVAADRTSRTAATRADSRSAPSLSQATEIMRGELPREFTSWDELPASWRSGTGEEASA